MAVEGWREVSLSAVATGITKGTTPTTFGYDYQPEGINFFRVENITFDGKLSLTDLKFIDDMAHNALLRSQLQNGDILISIAGALGRSAIVREDHLPANINQAIAIVRLSDAGVDHDFIRHAISGPIVQAQIKNVQAGLAQSNLNLQQVGELKIDMPVLPEQKKIAEILGSVDEAIAKTEALIVQTQKVKQGLLQTLLTKGIGHTKFKQTEIGEIPASWEAVRLLDHVSIPNGQVDPKKDQYKNLPLVAPNHIESNTGRLIAIETAEAQQAISGKFLFEAGDVIYSKIRPYLKKVTLAKFTGLCSADMYPMRCKNTLLPIYLVEILLSPHFTEFANSVSMRTGIPKINREELREYLFALPPIEEQKKIVKTIQEQDSAILRNQNELACLRKIKKGLMSDLLTGRIRVKLNKKNEKAA
jgi:type I restriction enzyme S subunit